MISTRGVMMMAVVVAMVLPAAGPAQAEDWSPLWSTATLSQARGYFAATSADGKVFFGGGGTGTFGGYSNVVDIFDAATLTRTTTSLSQARNHLAAASAGGKVFFGGGQASSGYSKVLDIYDTTTSTWSTAQLSQARQEIAAASAGNKVFFGGGEYAMKSDSNVVDIFDADTLTRTTTSLSQARSALSNSATSEGGKVFFGGGWTWAVNNGTMSNVVDIFDATTLTRTTTSLSQARYGLAATSAGGKAFFAGGIVAGGGGYSDVVDIYDTASSTWSTAQLSQVCCYPAATSVGGKVIFAGGGTSNVVDIYDTTTGTWSTSQLSQARRGLAAASAGNRAFFAGGYYGTNLTRSNVVDIYTLQNYGTITSTQAWTLVDNTSVAGRMLLSGGSLNLDGYDLVVGSMAGVAPITLGAHTLTTGGDDTSSTYSGALSGHGGLTKTGAGTLTLSNTSSYDGTTRVLAGGLKVTGSIAASSAVIDGGTLQGTGRVGAITGTSGHLHPGGSPGILASGNVAMSPGFCFDVSLNGPAAGTGYSQLDVTGTVNLGGATLGAILGYVPAFYSSGGLPDYLYIIKNDGIDPVTGQFAGLPQMSQFDLLFNGSAYKATISYEGDYDAGTLIGGNDVVVALPEPATLALLALGGLAMLRRRKKN
ncbi:MAG: autotransporter-associated beta strand repeat-containing protein [Planctomycetota bacterium]|nr:autotransporter-associated beta strand repeat-containing protein [Planctomycetota bacterium]